LTPIDVATYRRRAEQFIGALDREYYDHYAGLKPQCDFTAVYERFPELFTKAAVDELNAIYDVTQGDEKKRLAFLLEFAIDGFLGEQTKRLTDDIANTEARVVVRVDGEDIPFRRASIVQANEPDRERRRRIQRARLDAVEEHFNERYDTLWRTAHDLARQLGYPDYEALYAELKGVDFDLLRAQAEAFLQDTEGLYQRSLEKLLPVKLGIDLNELDFADLPHLMRAPEYDSVFSAARLLPTFAATLAGMGIDLKAQANVHIDAEPRELKSPRAFCAPVRIPGEIYLVVMPKGGQDDYSALLHEGGHTEHFAHTPADLPFEYRHLGDNAVTEGYAFIMDHLILNARWLDTYLGYGDSAEFLTFANIVELYFLRRYAGKMAYEVDLHRRTASLDGMGKLYSERLSEALMVDVPGESYLIDVDQGFYASNYLRAWMFEGALRMLLQDRFGMEWWRSEAGCAWLKGLWAKGQEYSADQLLLKNGGGKLDMDPLKHHIERALGR